jgi:hypothetical protein
MRLMDVTPTTTSTKRPSAKAPAAQPARKTLTASRKKSKTVEPASVESTTSSAELRATIEMAAFYLAAERGFAPGHELDDWLEAERRIIALPST